MADILKDYVRLRDILKAEKASMLDRLTQIDEVLGAEVGAAKRPKAPAPVAKAGRRRGRPPGVGAKPQAAKKAAAKAGAVRPENPITLRQAVTQVTKKGGLTKQEILAEVDKLGYRFAAKNPMISLNTLLYKSGKFKNQAGKWRAV
jgi:hypothetical protein